MGSSAEPVVVVSGADWRYERPLAVMLGSLVSHFCRDRHLSIHILDGGLGDEARGRLARSLPFDRVTLHWHRPERSALLGVPLWGRMPISTYDKLLAPQLLPGAIRKAIWLDADTLVLDDVGGLWDLQLDGHPALAVQDPLVPFVSSRFGIAGYKRLGLPPAAKYFNAGVMLLDLDMWRRDDVAGHALRYVKAYAEHVSFWDQEGLNVALAEQWGELDPEWNSSATLRRGPVRNGGVRDGSGVVSEPARIVHFSGNVKPWRYRIRSAHYNAYSEYVERAAWADGRPAARWRSLAFRIYNLGVLRRLLYPAEQLATGMRMALTRRYACREDLRLSP